MYEILSIRQAQDGHIDLTICLDTTKPTDTRYQVAIKLPGPKGKQDFTTYLTDELNKMGKQLDAALSLRQQQYENPVDLWKGFQWDSSKKITPP